MSERMGGSYDDVLYKSTYTLLTYLLTIRVKLHLCWFSCFYAENPCDQHTDRHTHRPRYVQYQSQ